jgi:hypothetical protein
VSRPGCSLPTKLTSLEFRLHEVDQVFAGPIFYNLEDADSLLHMFDEIIQDAPEQFGGFPAFQVAPPLPFIPVDRHGDTLAPWPWCTGRARLSRLRRS